MTEAMERNHQESWGWAAPHLAANATFDTEDKKKGKSGGFQSLGLSKELLNGIIKMGFNVPTPIQRKAIPPMMQGADIVAMARTGSGKTAAYVIPLLHQLREHCKIVGIRCLILSPTRELALQILQTVKNLGRFMTITHTALVGGKSFDSQFVALAMNPDIVVASPGRLLHVVEEAGMKLSRVSHVVLDEADRLFELGLQPQIVTILQRIPDSAQRALFSATMPSVLAEFTNAGLRNPVVVRLDAEMKLSDKLQQSAFIVRSDEKVAALIILLRKIIGVRRKGTKDSRDQALEAEKLRQLRYRRRFQKKVDAKKAERAKANAAAAAAGANQDDAGDDGEEGEEAGEQNDAGIQALVFVESKHHVEFLQTLLELYDIPTSGVHGHLDQEARKQAIDDFARRRTAVMVVTDVAARGIDLPLLDNVVNFSFPATPKLFVHRVGRVARAGRSGSAFSLLTMEDLPSYIDLMQFVGVEAKCSIPKTLGENGEYQAMLENPYDGYFGRLPEDLVQLEYSFLSRAVEDDVELKKAHEIVERAHKKFLKTKKKASGEGMRAAKRFTYETLPLHPVLLARQSEEEKAADAAKIALRGFKAKETYLDIVHGFRVFEVKKPKTLLDPAAPQQQSASGSQKVRSSGDSAPAPAQPQRTLTLAEKMSLKAATRKREREEEEAASTFLGIKAGRDDDDDGSSRTHGQSGSYKDESFFLADRPDVREENAQYSLRDATLDIIPETAEDASKARMVFAWNKRKNRFQKMHVNDAKALIKGIKNEAGAKVDFKKNKLEAYVKWTKTSNMRIQDVGEEEDLAAVEKAKSEMSRLSSRGDENEEPDAADAALDAEAAEVLKNPNQGRKLKIGRKLKRLPKEGKVRNFTEILNAKQKKEKQERKLEHRRAMKRARKGKGGGH